jgi:pimeloyl-ACP methyl ester carboxylesterase
MGVRMGDGRVIGLSEHGDPRGKPLLWFPGAPSCRLWPVPDVEAARAAGVRVVVMERPGYGVSDFQPNRRVLDWPRDVVEVADALGLDSFAVAGSSAGNPYVAACAYALPDRVRSAAIVGGPAPLDMPNARDGMTLRRRALFRVLGLAPYAVPLLRMLGPAGIDRVMTGDVPACDRRVLERIHEPYMASKREAFRAGLRGFALDLALVSRPWGFPLQSIRVPVHVWHGELDISTPIAMARCMAAAIPTSRARFFPDCGHFLAYQVWPEILSALMGT